MSSAGGATTPAPDGRHPCPCCGHLTLPDGPGGYDLCPVCFWENDGTQLRWPLGGGANGISLVEGQRAYRRHGAVDKRFRGRVRPPQQDEPLDTGWRPFDATVDWTDPTAAPMRCCRLVADLAVAAYRGGDPDLGLSIVTALAPGLDDTSDLYAPNCVAIGLLENDVWHQAWMQPHIDEWPPEVREEVRSQQNHVAQANDDAEAWSQLWHSAAGLPVDVVEEQLRKFRTPTFSYPAAELHLALAARVTSDRHWFRHHPVAALRLAWSHRQAQAPWRTIRWLLRPRFAG